MTLPARNAPCPCGSGRKYKKCCGGAEAHNAAEAARKERERAAAEAYARGWRGDTMPVLATMIGLAAAALPASPAVRR